MADWTFGPPVPSIMPNRLKGSEMSMRAVAINAVQQVRSSYWFLPTLLACIAAIAAQASLYLDHNPGSVFYLWPQGWETTRVDGARATLSVIAQSVLGVVGVMFSVTIVAVSFASGNFGPRLIGNFMRDRGTQWSLGILIATFVYALLILRAVRNGDQTLDAFVPHLSLGIAMALMGLSIITVIFYVHHIPETINVSNISAALGRRLKQAIRQRIDDMVPQTTDNRIVPPQAKPDRVLALHCDGYIQTYDHPKLLDLADRHDLYIQIRLGVGAFVNSTTPVMDIWAQSDWSEDIAADICACFVVGKIPTEAQNLLFIVQQLVEMTARALSPGVNDPYTAINCLNWLCAGLATASAYNGGLRTPQGSRVWAPPLLFGDIFDKGIVACHDYIKADALTSAHLNVLLDRLEDEVAHAPDRQIIRQFRKTIAKARNQSGPMPLPDQVIASGEKSSPRITGSWSDDANGPSE